MDEFNRPGTDVFIYLLSTRAGGVGINREHNGGIHFSFQILIAG